jgi:glycerol-3-phosphate dehydrogenase
VERFVTPEPYPLSPAGREAALEAMGSEPFDLLVVGGGITGAGVARDAALRGMRVALVEKSDYGAGTSSRSSKIIHGGVRYLEYLQIGLVRESALERSVLRRIAPHLVHPLPFLYPVFGGESLPKIRGGLLLFDLLAGRHRGEWSRRLDPEGTRRLLPGLRDPLKGSVRYPEFICDDARFTLANIVSAAEHGARVANHARVVGFLRDGERVGGASVKDEIGGRELEVRARVTVNATGPWMQGLMEGSGLPVEHPIVPSKGIHILLSRERLPLGAATFLRSPSGRSGLAMPRGPWVYVGTSDTEYRDDLNQTRAEPDEVDELLGLVQDCFPDAGIESGDVVTTWAGLRPLIYEEGKSTRDMSREDKVWMDPPGLVVVAGGKLTTYRRMARRILEAVARAMEEPLPGRETTDQVPLPGVPPEDLTDWRARTGAALGAAGVPAATVERLHFLYGTELETLLAWGLDDPAWLASLARGVPALRGEVRLAVERESALTLADILDRRLGLLLFQEGGAVEAAEEAARIAGELLDWDQARKELEVRDYMEFARTHGPRGTASELVTR